MSERVNLSLLPENPNVERIMVVGAPWSHFYCVVPNITSQMCQPGQAATRDQDETMTSYRSYFHDQANDMHYEATRA